ELTEIAKSGESAAVYILVLRAADEFEPNIETDKKFYENFYKALDAGVKIFPIQLIINISNDSSS
ncbi:MAG TPA: DNA/RNA nuclease SfsA, partial [Dysgonamonadaceae bacterium]|nr:DNA/RNA nuclease SfsA [Dysgonamonadaceae bacterium]